jgi:hypothetical protein
MKPLEKDELYQNLNGFLKMKGVELKDGSYAQTIHQACTLLSDAINLSQQGIARARKGVNEKLDQMRQVIHEKTAPKPPPRPAPAEPARSPVPEAAPAASSGEGSTPAAKPRSAPRPKRKSSAAKPRAKGPK